MTAFVATDWTRLASSVFTSMLSGVPGSVNREPLESSRLTTWPFCTSRPAVGGWGQLYSWSLWSCQVRRHVWISAYFLEIQPHYVLCPLRCWFSGCLWSPLISSHPLIPGWRGWGVTWWCKMFVRQIQESRLGVSPKGSEETHVETEDGAAGVLLCRQLLQVLVEQLKEWQVKQTDPGLLVLKYKHQKGIRNAVKKVRTVLITSSFSNRLFLKLVYLSVSFSSTIKGAVPHQPAQYTNGVFLMFMVTEDTLKDNCQRILCKTATRKRSSIQLHHNFGSMFIALL